MDWPARRRKIRSDQMRSGGREALLDSKSQIRPGEGLSVRRGCVGGCGWRTCGRGGGGVCRQDIISGLHGCRCQQSGNWSGQRTTREMSGATALKGSRVAGTRADDESPKVAFGGGEFRGILKTHAVTPHAGHAAQRRCGAVKCRTVVVSQTSPTGTSSILPKLSSLQSEKS